MNDLITAATSGLFVEVGKIIEHMKAQASRIADLEHQLAEASAPAVGQQPVGYISNILLTERRKTFERDGAVMYSQPAGMYRTPVFAAPQAADTDKVREAISDEQIMRIAGDVRQRNAGAWPGDVAFARAVLASMAAQAPVREVPEGWRLAPSVATDAMRQAGEEAYESFGYCDCGNAHGTSMDYVYEAMLAAAPVQQEPKP